MNQTAISEASAQKRLRVLATSSAQKNVYEAITVANKLGVTLLSNPLAESIIYTMYTRAYTGTIHLKQRETTDPNTQERWILENLPRDMETELSRNPSAYGFMNHGFEVTHEPLIQINQEGNVYVVTFRNPEKNIKILNVCEGSWGIPDETFGIPVQPSYSYVNKPENALVLNIGNIFGLVSRQYVYYYRRIVDATLKPSDHSRVLGYDNMADAPVQHSLGPLDGMSLRELQKRQSRKEVSQVYIRTTRFDPEEKAKARARTYEFMVRFHGKERADKMVAMAARDREILSKWSKGDMSWLTPEQRAANAEGQRYKAEFEAEVKRIKQKPAGERLTEHERKIMERDFYNHQCDSAP